jgi:hypothetical protein
MIWVALGLGGVGVVGVGVLVYLYVMLIKKANRFLKDLDTVLNTGRGWEKRWRVCQEMFAKKVIGR